MKDTETTTHTRPFDVAEYLDNEEVIAGFVSEALESGDVVEIASALGAVARARGMTEVARQAGLSRESLYRALSSKGNPELSTLLGVMKACGLRLTAVSAKKLTAMASGKTTTTRVRRLKRRRRPALAA